MTVMTMPPQPFVNTHTPHSVKHLEQIVAFLFQLLSIEESRKNLSTVYKNRLIISLSFTKCVQKP